MCNLISEKAYFERYSEKIPHPFSYYLILCGICEVLLSENLDISEKIMVFLPKTIFYINDLIYVYPKVERKKQVRYKRSCTKIKQVLMYLEEELNREIRNYSF